MIINNSSEEVIIPEINYEIDTYEVHPWRRYFARVIDLALIGMILSILGGFYKYQLGPLYVFLRSIIQLGLWVLCESIIMGCVGTTLGKWVMNIRGTDNEGNQLSFLQALKRSALVWVYGYGLGLPVVSLVTLIMSYGYLEENRHTRWDEKYHLNVTYGSFKPVRILMTILLIVAATLTPSLIMLIVT